MLRGICKEQLDESQVGLVRKGFREEVCFKREGCDCSTGQEIRERVQSRRRLRQDQIRGVCEEQLQKPHGVHRKMRGV